MEEEHAEGKKQNQSQLCDKCEWKRPLWRLRICYGASVVCFFLSVWCVLALTPPFSHWLPPVTDCLRKNSVFRSLSDLSAAAGVFFRCGSLDAAINLIGLTTTIAWLITAADQKILGVPIGRLIKWAYPGTILCYTFCFIPLALLGVYAGKQFPEAAFYAAVGILLLYAHFMQICIIMLLTPDTRECIVYSFYMDHLRHPSSEPVYLPSAILHRVVECARRLMEEEHHMNSQPTFAIWVEAIEHIGGKCKLELDRLDELVYDEIQGGQEPELKGLLLSQEAWSVLLRDPMSEAKRQQAARRLLVRLYAREGDGGNHFLQAFFLGGLVLALCRLFPPEKGWQCLVDICGPLKPLKGERSSGFSPSDQISYELTGFQQRMLLWGYTYCLSLIDPNPPESLSEGFKNIFRVLEQEAVLSLPFSAGLYDSFMDADAAVEAAKSASGKFAEALKQPVAQNTLWAWLEFLCWYVEWGFLHTWHHTYSHLTQGPQEEGIGSLERLYEANRLRLAAGYVGGSR